MGATKSLITIPFRLLFPLYIYGNQRTFVISFIIQQLVPIPIYSQGVLVKFHMNVTESFPKFVRLLTKHCNQAVKLVVFLVAKCVSLTIC